MSQGRALPHATAMVVAERLLEVLAPACDRIEIAGSLRRRKPEVHDIELVAVPRFEDRAGADLWSTRAAIDRLEERLGRLMFNGYLSARPVENRRADGSIDIQTKLGPAFKALITPDDVPVDLFVVRPPATWGCIFALRTGPGTWNTRLVTDCKAIGRKVEGGQVWRWAGSRWVAGPTPEEADFLAALGQPWVEPEERHVGRVHIERAIADAVSA